MPAAPRGSSVCRHVARSPPRTPPDRHPPRRPPRSTLRALVRAADRTICVAGGRARLPDGRSRARRTSRAVVIHNGVRLPAPSDAERADARKELGLSDEEPVGIWVGSLDERKDPLAAVRAAARASVALLVVGDGPLRSQVERTARSRYTSSVSVGTFLDFSRRADFFVLTSRREGLAFSLLEAMAHGLPAGGDRPARERRGSGRRGRRRPRRRRRGARCGSSPARRQRGRARHPRRAGATTHRRALRRGQDDRAHTSGLRRRASTSARTRVAHSTPAERASGRTRRLPDSPPEPKALDESDFSIDGAGGHGSAR